MNFLPMNRMFGVKVNRNPIVSELELLQSKLPQQPIKISEPSAPQRMPAPEAFFPATVPVIQNKTCKAVRSGIRHSVYKLARVCGVIRGKHIYDAQKILSNIDKKAASILSSILNNTRKNGMSQGMIEDKMFIKEIIVGKGIMMKKLDIKGRGRMGIIKVPKCSIRLVIEEKNPKDFYKMLLKGDCPIGVAEVFKKIMV